MTASEALFVGQPVHHIVRYEERLRQRRQDKTAHTLLERRHYERRLAGA